MATLPNSLIAPAFVAAPLRELFSARQPSAARSSAWLPVIGAFVLGAAMASIPALTRLQSPSFKGGAAAILLVALSTVAIRAWTTAPWTICAVAAGLFVTHPLITGGNLHAMAWSEWTALGTVPAAFWFVGVCRTHRTHWSWAMLGGLLGTAIAFHPLVGWLQLAVCTATLIIGREPVHDSGAPAAPSRQWLWLALSFAVVGIGTCIVGPDAFTLATCAGSSAAPAAHGAPLALVDRHGAISARLQLLPEELRPASSYLGAVVLLLALMGLAARPMTQPAGHIGIAVAGSLALLWALRGTMSFNEAIRSLFEYATVKRQVDLADQNWLGLASLGWVVLACLAFAAVARVLTLRRAAVRVDGTQCSALVAIAAVALVLAWWGTHPATGISTWMATSASGGRSPMARGAVLFPLMVAATLGTWRCVVIPRNWIVRAILGVALAGLAQLDTWPLPADAAPTIRQPAAQAHVTTLRVC